MAFIFESFLFCKVNKKFKFQANKTQSKYVYWISVRTCNALINKLKTYTHICKHSDFGPPIILCNVDTD